MVDVNLEMYEAAERSLADREAKRGLRVHGLVTIAVVAVLAVVNVFLASEFPWAIFPALGMSIGMWVHWYFGVRHGDESIRRHQEEVEREALRSAA